MAENTKRVLKSPYSVLIWIAVIALFFMGMVEWGYMTGAITKGNVPAPFGQWRIHLGVLAYVAWLVMTYVATRPAWFVKRYDMGRMIGLHRSLGIITVVLVCVHWYVYFGKAANSFQGWWGAYVSLVAFLVATVLGIIFLTPWLGNAQTAISKKTAIWLHRLNLIAILAACYHINAFRIARFAPFDMPLNVMTAVVVLYYLYWMIKKSK